MVLLVVHHSCRSSNSTSLIGACVFDPPDDNALRNDIVGEIDDNDRYLYSTNGCGDAAVPQKVNSLNKRNSHVLHIHADIGKQRVTTYYVSIS